MAGRDHKTHAVSSETPSGSQPSPGIAIGNAEIATRQQRRLFDGYVFVDWSATNQITSRKPKKDAIWAGWLFPGDASPTETYHRSRHEACQYVKKSLVSAVERKLRVLVGFDFPYGYPSGFAEELTGDVDQVGWQAVWQYLAYHIQDDDKNRNNRFEVAERINGVISPGLYGPFWGHPAQHAYSALKPTKPSFPFKTRRQAQLELWRLCERRLPKVQETWKLFGNGSVGSQTLVGIPYVHRLRYAAELRAFSKVWPFETNFAETLGRHSRPAVLHAEIWPGIVANQVARRLAREPNAIKDAVQVSELCAWVHQVDEAGQLADMLGPPSNLTTVDCSRCVHEEGWILGAL